MKVWDLVFRGKVYGTIENSQELKLKITFYVVFTILVKDRHIKTYLI